MQRKYWSYLLAVSILATASWAADKKADTPKATPMLDIRTTPVLSDAQWLELFQEYKAQADATIANLSFQLQTTQQLLQQEQRRREAIFDGALKRGYDQAGAKPEDWTLDMNGKKFNKIEKTEPKPEVKPEAKDVKEAPKPDAK